MQGIIKPALAALLVFLVAGTACAAGHKSEEAKAFVKKAVAFVRENGKQKAVAEFNDSKGRFVKGELYILVYDFHGVLLANPHNLKMVGHNRIDLKDVDGKAFVRKFIEVGKKGSGWVNYRWTNPVSGKIEPKSTYLESVDDVIVGCGIYK